MYYNIFLFEFIIFMDLKFFQTRFIDYRFYINYINSGSKDKWVMSHTGKIMSQHMKNKCLGIPY